jgi:hypothetical protein
MRSIPGSFTQKAGQDQKPCPDFISIDVYQAMTTQRSGYSKMLS